MKSTIRYLPPSILSLVTALTVLALGTPDAAANPNPNALACKSGFVWREARQSDLVCVTPAERTETRLQNRNAANNIQPGGGASGPNTCRQGYVWREAFSGDVTCVTPHERGVARQQNQLHSSRVVAAVPPGTCKSGFVWREARQSDLVCVTPAERTETRLQNRNAANNIQPGGGASGANTCRQGYVWREAFSGDVACVTPHEREVAKRQNRLHRGRVVR